MVYLVNIKVKSNKFVKEIFGVYIYICINEMIEWIKCYKCKLNVFVNCKISSC